MEARSDKNKETPSPIGCSRKIDKYYVLHREKKILTWEMVAEGIIGVYF
jgi:hypothetical protein